MIFMLSSPWLSRAIEQPLWILDLSKSFLIHSSKNTGLYLHTLTSFTLTYQYYEHEAQLQLIVMGPGNGARSSAYLAV